MALDQDAMVLDILKKAKDIIYIPVRDAETGRILRKPGLIDIICGNDMAAFSQLDDSLLDLIRLSEVDSKEVAEAARIWGRMQKRELYKMAGNLCIHDIKDPNKETDTVYDKQQEFWNASEEWQLNTIVDYSQGPMLAQSGDDDEVPETDGEEDEVQSSQITAMELESQKRSRRGKSGGGGVSFWS